MSSPTERGRRRKAAGCPSFPFSALLCLRAWMHVPLHGCILTVKARWQYVTCTRAGQSHQEKLLQVQVVAGRWPESGAIQAGRQGGRGQARVAYQRGKGQARQGCEACSCVCAFGILAAMRPAVRMSPPPVCASRTVSPDPNEQATAWACIALSVHDAKYDSLSILSLKPCKHGVPCTLPSPS